MIYTMNSRNMRKCFPNTYTKLFSLRFVKQAWRTILPIIIFFSLWSAVQHLELFQDLFQGLFNQALKSSHQKSSIEDNNHVNNHPYGGGYRLSSDTPWLPRGGATGRQIFQLGTKLRDHVSVYDNACLDVLSKNIVLPKREATCGGFNRTQLFFDRRCYGFQLLAQKEQLFDIGSDSTDEQWFFKNKENIKWISGLTVMGKLPNNGVNIAHFVGRVLFLFHVIRNAFAYSGTTQPHINILITAEGRIFDRIKYGHKNLHYHTSFLETIMHPYGFRAGGLELLYHRLKERKSSDESISHVLLHSVTRNRNKKHSYLCFDHAVVPGFLKARFFINDFEYPHPKEPPTPNLYRGSLHVPSDSLELRKNVRNMLGFSQNLYNRKNEIIILHRSGSRRVFSSKSEIALYKLMKNIARKRNFKFTVLDFGKMDFKSQVQSVMNVGIAVGIHGANLVNAIFMPPWSVLIEIFPYEFHHPMYVNGGNAGLKYRSYSLANGTDYVGLQDFPSTPFCIHTNHSCKVHYRDAELILSDNDFTEIAGILNDEITLTTVK